MVELKKSEYEYIEYEAPDETVVGSVMMQHGKLVHAELHTEYVNHLSDIEEVEAFLNEVKKLV